METVVSEEEIVKCSLNWLSLKPSASVLGQVSSRQAVKDTAWPMLVIISDLEVC